MPQQKNTVPGPITSSRVSTWPGQWQLNRNAPQSGVFIRHFVKVFPDVKKKNPRLKPFPDSFIAKAIAKKNVRTEMKTTPLVSVVIPAFNRSKTGPWAK